MRSLLLFAVAACAKVAEPVFEGPTIEVIEGEEFETTVRGLGGVPGIPRFEMHFPGGLDVVHLPDSLRIEGQELLAVTPNCNNESQVGVAMFPSVMAAAASDGGTPTPGDDNGTPNFVGIDVRGPHLARIVVGYSIDYTCGVAQRLSGETTFLIYATGRIVRADRRVRASTAILNDVSNCGCSGPGGAFKIFSTYWSFVPSGMNANRLDDSLAPDQPSNGACTIFGSRAVGVQFSQPTSRVRSNGVVSAHVFDFFNDNGTLNLGEQQMFSGVQIEPAGGSGLNHDRCQVMLDRLVDGPIKIGDSDYPSANEDGFYDDEVGIRSDPFVIRPPAGSSLPPGFTVAFQLERGNARITRNPPQTVEPLAYIQRDSPGSKRFLFVFNEGLADGESITVEPQ